ncbi:M16 family metallopeptidase [Brumimicrobium aurantiacum]|uniref:Insulinase family protein n=1 Tax=Brumimicrobium aurantiacum TaxID=1737063 RepID=A0A3E1EXV4_9FLAO|nr:pitrilysin family protein [Brumimicrobium aurantiacum]RFC54382.1 insulinase family protein [Brumimicrobium aurantiacum]
MVEFKRFKLDNGLRVIFHKDVTTPMAVVNTLYDVGARDESPERTGFAHLFEHLMFGGSVNIPNFDGPLQEAGGSNNAFTSNDVTNYYDVVPAQNLETALWLESDRMLSLAFTEKSLEVQRSVVIEEFKQRYLNQPYGDLWLEFRPLAYKVHPYQWATIGKNIEHIQEATMEEVKDFFNTHYHPGNAILCIAGNLELEEVKRLVNKWFADIPSKEKKVRNLPEEPKQTEFRTKTIEREVPSDVYTYGFKMPGKGQDGYYEADLISDVLGRGKSSRLYKRLKKELELVTEISAYVMGSLDTGLLIISVHPSDDATLEQIDKEIWKIIEELKSNLIEQSELEKIINKVKTTKAFSEQGVLNKSMALAMNELLGDANLINTETEEYEKITVEDLQKKANEILQKTNCSQLIIKAKIND